MANLSNINNKFLVTTGGNVGINTTSPGRKLTVTGDASGDANNLLLSNENDANGDSASIGFSMLSNNTYVKSGIFFERTTTQGRGSLHLAVNNEVNGNNVTKSDAKITISNTGNVGIGTTTIPADHILQISNAGQSYARVALTNSQTGNASGDGLIFQMENLNSIIKNQENGFLGFGTNGRESDIRIDSSGNVGIGTASPDLGGVSGTRVLTIASPTADRWGILELAGNRGWGGNQVGELKFISTDSTNNGTLVSLTAINDPSATGTGGSLKFSTRPNGGSLTERMRIKSDGVITFSKTANTTTPDASINHASNDFVYFTGGSGGASFGDNGHGTRMVAFNSDYLRFDTGDTGEKMRILGNGNVGIGTNSPDTKLTVSGEILSENSNGGYFVSTRVPSSSSRPTLNFYGTALDINYVTGYAGSGASTAVSILTNGNVGINSTNPAKKLDVESSSDSVAGVYIQAGKSSQGEIQNTGLIVGSRTDAATGDYLGISFSGNPAVPERGRAAIGAISTSGMTAMDLVFMTRNAADGSQLGSADERMRVDSSGNLGVGCTSSGARIEVRGGGYNSIRIGSTQAANTNKQSGISMNNYQGNGTSIFQTFQQNGDSTIYWGSADSGFRGVQNHYFMVNADSEATTNHKTAMRINGDGNVMIGNIAERGKLTINSSATSGNSNALSIYTASDGGTYTFAQFLLYGTSTVVGSITSNGTTTSYNETSDYRLKEDLQDFAGLDMVSKIPVYDFKWKSDESRSYGVMAHELQEVLPQAVVGEKDAQEMQSVDYSKIVPLLVKSIQELKAEIEELKK